MRNVRGHEPPPSIAAAAKLSRPAGPGSGALVCDLTLAVHPDYLAGSAAREASSGAGGKAWRPADAPLR
jgi:hypothetical protein